MNSSSLSSSIVLRSSFCFLSASVRRSAIAVCARVSAAFFSDTSSCNRAMVLCATAVTCATADSSPRDPGAPIPSRPPADAAMCASSRLRIASRSFSAFLAEAIACETSRSNVAHLLSASAARTLRDRIASICAEDHSLGLHGRGAGLHADGGGGSDGGESLGVCPASRSRRRLRARGG